MIKMYRGGNMLKPDYNRCLLQVSSSILKRVRRAIGIEYFEDIDLRHSVYTNIDEKK